MAQRQTSAAAKRKKLFFLAAACALLSALLAPTPALATRTLPDSSGSTLAPQLPRLEQLGADHDAGVTFALFGPEDRFVFAALTLLDHDQVDAVVARQSHELHLLSGQLARSDEIVWGQKTATGVSSGLGADKHLKWSQLERKTHRRSYQGLWTDPTTGLSYARNRWYDARTASWLSEDPLGPVDSPNLYAFVGWGPHMGTDPMGLVDATGFDALNNPVGPSPGSGPPGPTTERMIALYSRLPGALLDRVIGLALFPIVASGRIHDRAVADARKVADAYDQGGQAAANQEVDRLRRAEHKDFLNGTARAVPGVNTGFEVRQALEICEQDPGAPCGEAWAEVLVSAEIDAAVVYGAGRGVRSGRASPQSSDAIVEIELRFKPHGDAAEFARQLAGQEAGINRLNAGQIRANIEAFLNEGRPSSASSAIRAARRQCPSAAQGRAALHEPDCCIGGNPKNVTDFGGIPENCSIGAQNKAYIQTVYDAVKDLPSDSRVRFSFVIDPGSS